MSLFSIPPRPTTYRGIKMRSRLEARFAAEWLDAQEVEWTYEPRAYADQFGQYLPDFEIMFPSSGRRAFIEVKPTIEHAQAVLPRMQIIWASEPDAILMVFVDDVGWYFTNGGVRQWRFEPFHEVES